MRDKIVYVVRDKIVYVVRDKIVYVVRDKIVYVVRDKIDTSNIRIHERLLYWLGAGTSMKSSGGVKLVIWNRIKQVIQCNAHY